MFKKTSYLLLLMTILLVLVGCSAPAPPAEVDIQNLAVSVNVQTVYAIQNDPGVLVIDVREQWEYDEGHIPGVTLIPMNEVPARLSEIPTDKEVIVTCRSGNRSSQVVDFLQQQGFENVHNMTGGILAWQSAGLPVDR